MSQAHLHLSPDAIYPFDARGVAKRFRHAAIFGALFLQFIPNIADQISKAAPWAIYGVVLIGFVYLMPEGIAGFIRRARASGAHARTKT